MTDAYRCSPDEGSRPFRAALTFPVTKPGRLTSLVAWFTAELAPGTSLTNAPGAPKTHWRLATFPLNRAVSVERGTEVAVEFVCELAGPGYCHVRWSARIGDAPWEHHDTRAVSEAGDRATGTPLHYSYPAG